MDQEQKLDRVEDITQTLWGMRASASMVSDLNQKIYGKIDEWRHGRWCRVLCVPRVTYRYRSCLDPRTELRMRIREIAQARVRYGYRKTRVLLNRKGWAVGEYLAYRL